MTLVDNWGVSKEDMADRGCNEVSWKGQRVERDFQSRNRFVPSRSVFARDCSYFKYSSRLLSNCLVQWPSAFRNGGFTCDTRWFSLCSELSCFNFVSAYFINLIWTSVMLIVMRSISKVKTISGFQCFYRAKLNNCGSILFH